ncbi:MAG TPA: hypothetical protein VLZ07_09370 [Syntrophales bacterium]|nr:hypothetical protein [Syntrophales bacterium]
MIKIRFIAVAVVIIVFATYASAQDITPGGIFEKVTDTYESLQTYRANGTIISDVVVGGRNMRMETSFSILLKKLNMYLISWTQKDITLPSIIQGGAVWSDGTQPYLYIRTKNEYSKIASDEAALASATGISGGAAFMIPSLFFSELEDQIDPFSRLKDLVVEKSEKIGKEDCYVVSGTSLASKKETYWISKSKYLILKCTRSLEPPEGSEMPKVTDEQLDETLKVMGRDLTEENRKSLRSMMEMSRSIAKAKKMTGLSVETHTGISSPELAKADFQFALPKNAVLKDTFFDSVFGGNK